MHATVFQYHILPFIVGVGLCLSGNLWHIPIGVAAWVLSIRFQSFFLHIFPLAVGWAYGSIIFSRMYPNSKFWSFAGGIIGIGAMFVICSIVVAIVTSPSKRKIPKKREKVIEGLDDILKYLFIILVDIYRNMFPNDPDECNLHRGSIILNELVLEDLRGDQIEFRNNNADFINREKSRVIELENVKRGIVHFLIAKGAFYRILGNPKSDIWITEIKRLRPDVIIPDTIDEILEIIENCIKYYEETGLIGKDSTY